MTGTLRQIRVLQAHWGLGCGLWSPEPGDLSGDAEGPQLCPRRRRHPSCERSMGLCWEFARRTFRVQKGTCASCPETPGWKGERGQAVDDSELQPLS